MVFDAKNLSFNFNFEVLNIIQVKRIKNPPVWMQQGNDVEIFDEPFDDVDLFDFYC
jgi:hypothetical protein